MAGGPPSGFPAGVLQCVPYKKPTDTAVYIVGADWQKHGFVSWSAFLACGFTEASIRADTINNLDRIVTGVPLDGLAAFQAQGCAGGPPPPPPPPPPGGLPAGVLRCVPYRKPADSVVYVIGADSLKHGFTSWAAFLACGFTGDDVRADTINNLDLVATGSPIDGPALYLGIGCTPQAPAPTPNHCASYQFGECTWGVCELAPWVAERWGDARDWPHFAALAGFNETPVPTVGAVACYGAGHGYSGLGHVGLVVAVHPDGRFDVREMNYVAFDQYDLRTSTMDDVVTFILPPGVDPGGGGAIGPGGAVSPPADLETAWQQFADFWNTSIDRRVDELAQITSHLQGH